MRKQLARLEELHQSDFLHVMEEINQIARKAGLRESLTYSRLWEYPWLWFQLKHLEAKQPTVLDVGTEESPFPWFLASHGFNVLVSDITHRYWPVWRRASQRLNLPVRKRVLDTQALNVATATIDICLSVSVLEHVPAKPKAIAEAARVLRPGGLLVMTFDICEPELGMSFPEWNGRAVTLAEFDDLFKDSTWFEPGLERLPWNMGDIPPYLSWHRTTAPHHNYVTGAAIVRRNQKAWTEPLWKDVVRVLKGGCRARHAALECSLVDIAAATKRSAARLLLALARKGIARLSSPQTTRLLGERGFRLLGLRQNRPEVELPRVGTVLVVRLDEIGDVVMTIPLLRELRRNIPQAWISLVVKPSVHNFVELCPYVNEVLTYDWSAPEDRRELYRHIRALRLAWQHLWPRRFDLAILPRWDVDAYHGTFITYFSGARWRVGYSENVVERKRRANAGYDQLFTHVLDHRDPIHEVERNLEILRFLGGEVEDERLELWPSAEDDRFAADVLRSHGAGAGNRLVALSPGAGVAKRRWPLHRFVALGDWLRTKYRVRPVMVGGPDEQALGQEIARRLNDGVIDMVGRTTLRQAGALLKRCHLLIGNDAGLMHVGAAAGVPVIEVSCHPQDGSPFHQNSPARFRPWGVPHFVVQPAIALAPCSDGCEASTAHCITGVTLEQVQAAVDELLGKGRVGLSHPPGCHGGPAPGKSWLDPATRATAQCG